MPARRTVVQAALLWGLAAAYFLLAIRDGIEGMDEGHLVYFSWRTAEGALPYRDFQHWYGPAVFFLNGLLLRGFGADLLVVRLALVGLRAMLAVAVFLLTRAMAGPALALVAYGVAVAVAGAPLWIYDAPYASNYQLPLVLAALVVFVLMPARPRARLVLTGALLGLAATFKPTTGLLPLAGVLLFLFARAPLPASAVSAWFPWRPLALAVPAAVLGILAVFGVSMGGPWMALLLLTPIAMLTVRVADLVWSAPAAASARNLGDAIRLGIGFAIAPACAIAFYAAHGALGALVWSTATALPRTFAFAVPYQLPDRVTVVLIGLAAASMAAVGRGRGRWLALAVAGSAFVAGGFQPGVLSLHAGVWMATALRLWTWVPPAAVWGASVALLRSPAAGRPEPVAVGALVTAALLPLLAPVADWPHLLLMLPVFLPLTAWGLATAARRSAPVPRPWAFALLLAWVVGATGPFVAMLATARAQSAPPPAAYDRATGIIDRRPEAAAAADVVRYLSAHLGPGQRVLVVPSQLMLCFLSGRQSALDRDEFFLYAAVAGPALSAPDARRFADQVEAIRSLDAERPLVVRGRGPAAAAFRAVFPDLAAYLDHAYRPVVDFGAYEVLEWAAVDTAGSDRGDPGRR